MSLVQIYGSVETSVNAVSLYKREILTGTDKSGQKKSKVDLSDVFGTKRLVDITWLKGCSNKYHISDKIEDYVVAPVPLITSDIPNRNAQAFTLASLLDFSTDHGCLRYKTFVGKATFEEHKNSDPTKAKGVNFDSSLLKVPHYAVAKVIVLSGFDRSKDSTLANAILKGEREGYSMGATCSMFKCSICSGLLGPNLVRTCTCHGTDYTNLASLGRIVQGRLHYHMALDPVFFENSSVREPADTTALTAPL